MWPISSSIALSGRLFSGPGSADESIVRPVFAGGREFQGAGEQFVSLAMLVEAAAGLFSTPAMQFVEREGV